MLGGNKDAIKRAIGAGVMYCPNFARFASASFVETDFRTESAGSSNWMCAGMDSILVKTVRCSRDSFVANLGLPQYRRLKLPLSVLLFREEFDKSVGDVGTVFFCDALAGLFDLLHLSTQVIA